MKSFHEGLDPYFNDLLPDQRIILKKGLGLFLSSRKEVIFAYLFGSFIDGIPFKDIDLALFLDPGMIAPDQMENYGERCSEDLADIFRQIFDVSILNDAPASFVLNVLKKGELLFSKDDRLRTNLIEECSIASIKDKAISFQYLKEIVF